MRICTSVEHFDICLPDYLQEGSRGGVEVMAVPLHHGITYAEVFEFLHLEFCSSSDEPMEGFQVAVEDCFNTVSDMGKVFWNADPADLNEHGEVPEGAETVYAYFRVRYKEV